MGRVAFRATARYCRMPKGRGDGQQFSYAPSRGMNYRATPLMHAVLASQLSVTTGIR